MGDVIFPLMVFWGIALILYFIRSEQELIWKVSVILIFFFYFLWFKDDFFLAMRNLLDHTNVYLPGMIKVTGQLLGLGLLILWPLILFFSFFSASPALSRDMVRMITVITLFYWLFWFLFYFTGNPFEDSLNKILPPRLPG